MMRSRLSIDPPIIAHRGASHCAPENTISAFTKALTEGARWIEFDVMLAACGTPIVFHDESLERVAGIDKAIKDCSYDYLQTVDVGGFLHPQFKGEHIPTLEETLQWLISNDMNANIEIKPLPGQESETVARSVPFFQQYLTHSNIDILYSSFSTVSLSVLRNQMPRALLGFLMHEWQANWHNIATQLDCVTVNINQEIMTVERAYNVRQSGRQLLCYTVNDANRYHELLAMGVEVIFTDHPAQMIESS